MGVPSGSAGAHWTTSRRVIDLSRPCIMGVLNVTPDSFSGGSRFTDPELALDRALQMEEEGADIIDVGGESTRPFAPPVDAEEELRRVLPVVERLAAKLRVPVSVDTYKACVADASLHAGAEIVNDVSGLTFDPDMARVVSASGAGVVLMHTRGTPQEMQKDTAYVSLVQEIIATLGESLSLARKAGIAEDRIVVDPGIGFGKSVEANLEILGRLREFQVLGRPVLIGTSRKSFIGKVLGREVEERLFGTAATVAVALMNGATIFRVHDVPPMRDVVDMTQAILHS
ncbi:MAG: dihydropteroate synthase [Geobacter sp.]|nr:dihydropteroate synthase [Geobacter sp.]